MYDPSEYAKNRDRLIWVGVDLDGTLADSIWPTLGIGEPIHENIKKLEELEDAGYKIIVHTARAWSDYENVEAWLKDHDVPFREIQCGKPLYAAYIDDRAVHADSPSWLPPGGEMTPRELRKRCTHHKKFNRQLFNKMRKRYGIPK